MQGIRGYHFFVVGVGLFEGLRKNFYVSVYIHLFINEGVIMINLGKIIDKLIEISTTTKMPKDCRLKLDTAIEELIHFHFEFNHNSDDDELNVPDFRDLSPEEIEEFKEFEMIVRTIMNDNIAMA